MFQELFLVLGGSYHFKAYSLVLPSSFWMFPPLLSIHIILDFFLWLFSFSVTTLLIRCLVSFQIYENLSSRDEVAILLPSPQTSLVVSDDSQSRWPPFLCEQNLDFFRGNRPDGLGSLFFSKPVKLWPVFMLPPNFDVLYFQFRSI